MTSNPMPKRRWQWRAQTKMTSNDEPKPRWPMMKCPILVLQFRCCDPGAAMEACFWGFDEEFNLSAMIPIFFFWLFIFVNLMEGIFEILKFWWGPKLVLLGIKDWFLTSLGSSLLFPKTKFGGVSPIQFDSRS